LIFINFNLHLKAIDLLILNKKITPYIYILFFSFFSSTFYGQENNYFSLEIKSKNSLENSVIKSINYSNKFNKIKNLNNTKDSVLAILKEKGYYTVLIDSMYQQKKKYTYYLKLGVKIKTATIKVSSEDEKILRALNLNLKNKYLVLENEKLKPFLNSISNYLIENGQLFSKVRLINSKIKNQSLFTELQISRSKKRSINKTIVNGYTDFPTSFIKQYLNLNDKSVLNENKIEEISKKINQLNFVSEIKKPEILFSKDSTILYLYLKKKKSSSFDGLINFSTENKKLNFRGYLDLNLVNIFNKGEEIKINWKNNSNNKQDLTLQTKITYIFNSKISSEVSFNFFRNDSTYINTQASMSLHYPITNNINISFIAKNEASKISNSLTDFENYQKLGLGLGIAYTSFNSHKFDFEMELLHKTRKTEETTSLYQLNINTSSIFSFSKKINFLLKNALKLTSNQTTLKNELFRSGGTNSIRGFQENSILSNSYTYVNSEFRLNTKTDSYIYSIHDIGIFNIESQNKILKSIGFGYQFTKGNSKIDINGTFNNLFGNNYLETSIISIKIVTLF